MTEEKGPEPTVLEQFFEKFKRGDPLLILTHNHPDPDSLSSAAALQEIARFLGDAKTTIAYGGIIGRSENAHMVKYLKLRPRPVERIRFSDFEHIAMVDTQPRTGNNALPPKRIPDLVIDHHPMTKPTRKVPFADIREEYGATASILAEYLFHFGLEIDRNLATALLYGIKSETQDLGREAYKIDIDCYLRLFPIANKRLLAKIVNSRVPQTYFRSLRNALQNAQLAGNAILTRLGKVPNPDMIPEIADLMLRLQTATWALCIGEYKGGLYVSIRTTNPRKNAGTLMKRLVRGKGTGGGHGMMAGAQINLPEGEPEKVLALEDEIENDFLHLIDRGDRQRTPLIDDEDEPRGRPAPLAAVRGVG